MVVAQNVASVIWASLVDTHPLWLLTLSSLNRYLVLTTNQLDAWSYYTVATLRLLAPDPLFYLLGMWYGASAIGWMERRLPSVGQSLRMLETAFTKARYAVVFVAPNNPVCLLAGAALMRPVPFFLTNLAGTLTRLALIRAFGDVFSSPLRSVTDFVGEYRWYVVAGSAALFALMFLADRRRGGPSELEALRHLDEELGTGDGSASGPGAPGGRRERPTGSDPE